MAATVETLAREFGKALRSLVSAEDMQEIILRNRNESRSGICHSHDFCDANVVLHEVFLAHGMDIADEGGRDRWGTLWVDAWNLAQLRDFRAD